MTLRRGIYFVTALSLWMIVTLLAGQSVKPSMHLSAGEPISNHILFGDQATQAYSLSYSSTVDMAQPLQAEHLADDRTARTTVVISGDLFSKIMLADKAGTWMAFQLLNARCESSSGLHTDCQEIYGALFLARLGENGEIIQSRFPEYFSRNQERSVLSMIEPLKIASRDSSAGVWDSVEEDSLGSALVRHVAHADGSLSREKLDYLSLKDESGFITRAQIKSSNARLTPSKERAWFDSADISERISLFQETRKQIEFQMSLRMDRLKNFVESPSWSTLSLEQIQESLANTGRMARLSPSPSRKEIEISEIAASMNQELSPGERIKLSGVLAKELRSSPERSREIPDLLRNPVITDIARGQLIYGLQSADTQSSQEVMRALVEDSSMIEADRHRALIALGFMTIDSESTQMLWKLSAQEADPNQAAMALLAIGNGAKRLLQNNSALGPTIVEQLKTKLAEATDRNHVVTMERTLLALGNTGDKASGDLIQGYLHAESDRVREAAAQAIQVSNNDSLIEPLAVQLLEEEAPSVRAALVDSISKFPVSEATFATALQAFIEEEDRSVRLRLAKYIRMATREFPEGKRAIGDVVYIETDPQVHAILADAAAE